MCFAPEADAIAGGLIVAVGVDALRHVGSRKQLALAALPLLFGLHQLTEMFVWLGLQGRIPEWGERVAVWIWLLFAFAALPLFLPIAVELVEGSKNRRRVIRAFAAMGLVVGVTLAIAIFRGPIGARIEGHCIAYRIDPGHGRDLTALYVIAACGALLASSHRELAALGALNIVVVPLLMWLTISGFVSLWCFWAAIASAVIAIHLRRAASSSQRRGVSMARPVTTSQNRRT